MIQPSLDQPACGAAFTRRGIERYGNRAIGVVVWIDGLRSGKPLPVVNNGLYEGHMRMIALGISYVIDPTPTPTPPPPPT